MVFPAKPGQTVTYRVVVAPSITNDVAALGVVSPTVRVRGT